MHINIAQIGFKISNRLFSSLCLWENSWKLFVSKNYNSEKVQVDISYLEKEAYSHGLENYRIKEDAQFVFRIEMDIMLADESKRKIVVLPVKNIGHFNRMFFHIFYIHAVQYKMLQFHSSIIKMNTYGLMFLGPSGIGKTTQAELWNRYRDALIINGDVVFVQETEAGFLGWGTPWHGSSPYCENTNVPVYAMIVLKQSEVNSIRELTGFEKVTAVSQSVFYPRWIDNSVELCLETLDHLLTKIPVYELSCRPDEDAVCLTEQTIFRKDDI